LQAAATALAITDYCYSTSL